MDNYVDVEQFCRDEFGQNYKNGSGVPAFFDVINDYSNETLYLYFCFLCAHKSMQKLLKR